MARRAVQGIAVEQGAKNGSLHAQLKELETKATLHPTMVEWADHIRLLGNVGAHPGARRDGRRSRGEVSIDALTKLPDLADSGLSWPDTTPSATASRSSTAAVTRVSIAGVVSR